MPPIKPLKDEKPIVVEPVQADHVPGLNVK